MEWHQLENVLAVAEKKNFTKAAKKQAVSQPALSRSILKLEEELGVNLFIRGKRDISLTPYGVIFVEKAEKARRLMQEAAEEINHLASPGKGRISIAFLPTFGPHVLPRLIADYKKLYPGVSFQLSQGAGETNVQKVQGEEADLCITAPPYERPDIEWTVVREEQLYVTVPIGHRFADYKSISFIEASKEEFVSFKKGFGLRRMFDVMCDEMNVHPEITFEGEEATTIAGFVSAGLGLSVLPKNPEIAHEPLCFLEISDYRLTRKIAIGTKKNRTLSPAVRQFKQFAEEYIKQKNGSEV